MSDDDMESLPPGWARTTLGEALRWGSGGTPKRTVREYYGGEIPWAIIGDLRDDVVIETQTQITEQGLRNGSAKWVAPGSVLIAMYGSIGKLGIAGTALTTNQAIAFTHPDPISTHYLFWYLRSCRDDLAALGKGGTQSNISQTVIKAFPFPLAPLAEQRRIVDEIETQFSRLDAAVTALGRARINLKRYRAAVLSAACSGRLVPTEAELARAEGRSYEPADDLLARIVAECRARSTGRYRDNTAPDPALLPILPGGWTSATVDQVSEVVQYGSSAKTSESWDGVPVLRMGNIIKGSLSLGDLKYLPHDHAEFPELLLEAGDVLFNRTNSAELVGKTAVYRGTPAPCSFASYLIRVRLNRYYLSDLLATYINSVHGRRWITSVANQQVGQANVNGSKLKALTIPVPPLAEQERIITEVERRLSVIDELEATIAANLKRAARLRQAILHRAFTGKLVPQDPTDEPATLLLDRIRAERAAINQGPRSKRCAKPAVQAPLC